METELTIFLARLLGTFSIMLGLSMLVQRKMITEVFHKMEADRQLVYAVGLAEIVGGLLLVLQHNIWSSPAETLITILGWLLFSEGIIYAVASKKMVEKIFRWYQKQRTYFSLAISYIVMGLFLAYWGFFTLAV